MKKSSFHFVLFHLVQFSVPYGSRTTKKSTKTPIREWLEGSGASFHLCARCARLLLHCNRSVLQTRFFLLYFYLKPKVIEHCCYMYRYRYYYSLFCLIKIKKLFPFSQCINTSGIGINIYLI